MLGESSINLKEILSDCQLVKQPLSLNKNYFVDVMKKNNPDLKMKFDKDDDHKFIMTLMGKNEAGKIESSGEVTVSIDVLPLDTANKNPVGKARDSPNHSPQLPQPEGRLELSFNPIKMFNQFVGPVLRRKIYMGLCCLLCILILIPVLPNLIANGLLKMLFG
jgi:hypothetical protein